MNEMFVVQIPGFTRYFRDASEESLIGDGSLSGIFGSESPLKIKNGDKSIFITEIAISLHADIVDSADELRGQMVVDLLVHDDGVTHAEACANLWVPSQQFSALRDASQPSVRLTFFISKELSFNDPLSKKHFSNSRFSCDVTNISLSFSEERLAPLPLYDDEIIKIVEQWVLNRYSQIGQIGVELIKSLNVWLEQNPKGQNDRDEYLDIIGNLISELRQCYYRWSPGLGDQEDYTFLLDSELSRNSDSFLKII